MEQEQPKILTVKPATYIDAQGRTVKQISTSYTIGPHGPFTITVDEETFDPAVVRSQIEQMRAKLAALVA